MDRRRLAINQVTTPRWSLRQAIDGYARRGVGGIGIWRDRLAELGLAAARAQLADAGLWVPTLCKTGEVARLDAQGPDVALDDCRRAIDEANAIGAGAVVFVCGGIDPSRGGLPDARRRVAEVLTQASEHARAANVHIGLEPFHPMHAAERGCINTLAQAHSLRRVIGDDIAVILDVFHCWWDPDLASHLCDPRLAGVASVHLCDWRVPTRHPVMDRAMPGDGAADVASLVRALEQNGYRGPYEFEVFSDDWAARDPGEVVDICIARYHAMG